MNRFACQHCGREHLVRRQAGHVELTPVLAKIERISQGMDRHASELAIKRLKGERREIKERQDEWRRELWHTKQDIANARTRMIAGLFIGMVLFNGGLLALITSRTTPALAPLATFVGLAASGLGLHQWFAFKRHQAHEVQVRKKLGAISDKLDACDDELDHHRDVVKR